ncbi:MAG: phosphatase PAP2 family protein [Bacillota bacterium]|nr:phosphatase PAP2 family protein [Bacillota bacterium]
MQIIRFIQSLGNPVLDIFFICVTSLGSDEFLMIVLASMYWSVDKALGYMTAMVLLASTGLNNLIKDIIRAPRPWAPAVRVVYTGGATGFSFPSGHTQNTATFWGVLCRETRVRWIAASSALVIPLVGLSRMYLGVHWPVDVLGGLFFGGLVILLYPSVIHMGGKLLDGRATAVKAIAPVALSMIFLAVDPTIDAAKIAGFVAGFGAGAIVEAAVIGFSELGPKRKRIQRFVLGAILVLAVRFGLKALLPDTVLFTYLRYTAVGLAGSLAAPATFVRLRLADRR